MKIRAAMLLTAILACSCSLFSSEQIEPTDIPIATFTPPVVEPESTDTPGGSKFIPVYLESPERVVEGTEISTAELGKYLAVYLEPPGESGLKTQFLLLEEKYLPEEQIVPLASKLFFTQIDEVDLASPGWEMVGMISGKDTLTRFKEIYGESDLVIIGIQEPPLAEGDLSGYSMTIYDSPFEKVKYARLEDWSKASGSSKKLTGSSNLTIYLTAVYVPWEILGNLLEQQAGAPVPIEELTRKFMCGPDPAQGGACEGMGMKEEFVRQEELLSQIRP